jgi:hypothetical protein
MAHIVQFRASAEREVSECEPRGHGSAQIIIFPGVRRERRDEPDAREGGRERIVRDRLELPD